MVGQGWECRPSIYTKSIRSFKSSGMSVLVFPRNNSRRDLNSGYASSTKEAYFLRWFVVNHVSGVDTVHVRSYCRRCDSRLT